MWSKMAVETSGNMIADRRFAMAMDLHARGDSLAAIDILEQTKELVPEWPVLYFRLGEIYMHLGRNQDAVDVFTDYLRHDSTDKMGAIIKLNLLGVAAMPQSMPADYVEALFDDYADRFDTALVKNLSYRVPWLLADLMEEIKPYHPEAAEQILDMGCGTGLSGEAFAKRATWIEGVDMSSHMLLEAEHKKIYNTTVHAEASAFLSACEKTYDIIVAADVLVYIGALEELFKNVERCLAENGYFVFSTQKMPENTGEIHYLLGHDHRYAHHLGYIQHCAVQAGLDMISNQEAFLRHDGVNDIYGHITVLKKTTPIDASLAPYMMPVKKRSEAH